MPGTTARETETVDVLLVGTQAGAAAGAPTTASPMAGAAAEAAIAGPVMAAGALSAPRDTDSATRQGQPRNISTIGESGDTTIPSPGMASKQPLPGQNYMILYMVG